MRRLLRLLLNAATALSLVLCVATVVLWVRSYRWEETAGWYVDRWNGGTLRHRSFGFDSDSGGLAFFLQRRHAQWPEMGYPGFSKYSSEYYRFKMLNPEKSQPEYWRGPSLGYAYRNNMDGWQFSGFAYYHGEQRAWVGPLRTDDHYLLLPHWFVALALIAAPAARAARFARRRRMAANGLCPACGYDLRATPDRCPECGATPRIKPKRRVSTMMRTLCGCPVLLAALACGCHPASPGNRTNGGRTEDVRQARTLQGFDLVRSRLSDVHIGDPYQRVIEHLGVPSRDRFDRTKEGDKIVGRSVFYVKYQEQKGLINDITDSFIWLRFDIDDRLEDIDVKNLDPR